ncbi:hypothetical protein C8Q74DRAFT_1258069 [Fomes fomentarius]|nr:hypothetical protein C8Q74DRAFT_1258069 [Fomes fomentarius]
MPMPKWLKNGFKSSTGEPAKDAPLIRYFSALLDFRAREGQKIHLQYVKGYAGIEGNEGADQLANVGAMMAEESERDWVVAHDMPWVSACRKTVSTANGRACPR